MSELLPPGLEPADLEGIKLDFIRFVTVIMAQLECVLDGLDRQHTKPIEAIAIPPALSRSLSVIPEETWTVWIPQVFEGGSDRVKPQVLAYLQKILPRQAQAALKAVETRLANAQSAVHKPVADTRERLLHVLGDRIKSLHLTGEDEDDYRGLPKRRYPQVQRSLAKPLLITNPAYTQSTLAQLHRYVQKNLLLAIDPAGGVHQIQNKDLQ